MNQLKIQAKGDRGHPEGRPRSSGRLLPRHRPGSRQPEESQRFPVI